MAAVPKIRKTMRKRRNLRALAFTVSYLPYQSFRPHLLQLFVRIRSARRQSQRNRVWTFFEVQRKRSTSRGDNSEIARRKDQLEAAVTVRRALEDRWRRFFFSTISCINCNVRARLAFNRHRFPVGWHYCLLSTSATYSLQEKRTGLKNSRLGTGLHRRLHGLLQEELAR